MMVWYQILSLFLTNGIRIFLGLYLVTTLLKLPRNPKKASIISACAAFMTILSCFLFSKLSLMGFMGVEMIVLVLAAHYLFMANLRMSLFLTFFYEMAVALWEFILSAGMGVLFRSESFLDITSPRHLVPVWFVRLFMVGIYVLSVKGESDDKNRKPLRILSGIAVAGLFGVIFLSGQHTIPISDNQLTTWLIFSMLIPVAVLIYNLNRQFEMEKTIAQLETEKNALLKRDYQTLSDTYATNAKLFHDFHNHIEILHRYLSADKTAEAISYLDELRSPIQSMTQTVWIGDVAIDYLINSKIALATSRQIRVSTNIEFPRHTNIRSVDLAAILGNLLDNALDATEDADVSLRFINLTIRRINDMLIIKVENGCSVSPISTDGNLQTSKKDKSLHGWGLKSARAAAEHYDGVIETAYSNHIFRAVVNLSFEAVKT